MSTPSTPAPDDRHAASVSVSSGGWPTHRPTDPLLWLEFFAVQVAMFVLVSVALAGLLIAVEGEIPKDISAGWAAAAGGIQLVVTVSAIQGLAHIRGRGSLTTSYAIGPSLRFAPWLFVGLAFSLVSALTLAGVGRLVDVNESPQGVAEMVSEASGLALVGLLVVVVFGAPIAEELLYRGLLYGAARQYLDVVSAGLVSGIFFALVHVPDLSWSSGSEAVVSILGLCWFCLLGVVAARLVERERSIMPAMWFHMGFNVLGAILLVSSSR